MGHDDSQAGRVVYALVAEWETLKRSPPVMSVLSKNQWETTVGAEVKKIPSTFTHVALPSGGSSLVVFGWVGCFRRRKGPSS